MVGGADNEGVKAFRKVFKQPPKILEATGVFERFFRASLLQNLIIDIAEGDYVSQPGDGRRVGCSLGSQPNAGESQSVVGSGRPGA
jgi:hypothetical protein